MNSKIQMIINEWELNDKEIKQIYDSAWQVGEGAVLKNVLLKILHNFLCHKLWLPR